MKLSGKFLLIILSLSIISYGMSSSVYASSHSIPPVSISTDKASYATGDAILLSGFVKDYDGEFGLTIMIVNAQGNVVYVAQPTPNSDGNYSSATIASGMIKLVGEYIVKVNYGPQSNKTIFEFVGGEGSVPSAAPQEAPEPVVETVVEPEPEPVMEVSEPVCGKGTVLKDGLCVVEENERGGGCLIATAAYGSEMAPQIQFLREIRDNTVLQTESGTSFMAGFNQFYYSFSPVIADYERENPAFKETVKLALTPMLTSLVILNYVDIDSEAEMLGYGIGIILLNIGMYFVAPAIIIMKIKNRK
uniref:Peptidyl-prolyl isomerase n=1 Tax=uncultured marine thaumarchaeote KM3_61_H06 TaxID=1456215 RepID=A0A075HBR3_9ARCH|nr:hypothetical protein [uncultured marine thaumarchaeote KM3_61_H06]